MFKSIYEYPYTEEEHYLSEYFDDAEFGEVFDGFDD